MITFDVGKKNKILFQCTDKDIFNRVREYFSVANTAAKFAKRFNRFIPSRKYVITPTGQCDFGMFWEIKNFLYKNQITAPIQISESLQQLINCKVNCEIYEGLNLPLRDYQQSSVKLALQSGRGICVLGTGAGKTLTTACLIESYFIHYNKDKHFKCLVLVPDLSLVNQTYKEFIDVGVSFSVTRWTGNLTPDLTSNCIICNISILQSQFEANDWVKHIDLLIVDECHKAKAIETGKIINQINTIHKYGFTGTLPNNNEDLWSVVGKLGPVLTTKTSAELRSENHLTNVETKVLKLHYKNQYVFEYKEELDFIYTNDFRNNVIKKICDKFQNNVLILVNHIKHGEALYEHMRSLNKQVYFIRGEVEVEERDKVKQILEENNNVVCIAISAIFSTGINIKNIHMIFFAAGGKSFIRTVQSIGRGLRLHPTKTKLTIIDLQDMLKYGIQHGNARQEIYDTEKIPFTERDIVEY